MVDDGWQSGQLNITILKLQNSALLEITIVSTHGLYPTVF